MLFKTYFSGRQAVVGKRRASHYVMVASFWLVVVLLGYGLLRNMIGVRLEQVLQGSQTVWQKLTLMRSADFFHITD